MSFTFLTCNFEYDLSAVKLLRVRRATSTPVFNQDQYTGEVKNNAKGGHVILQVQATVTGLQVFYV